MAFSDERLAQLRSLHESATPPPWIAHHDDYDNLDILAVKSIRPVIVRFDWDDDRDYGEWVSEDDRSSGIESAKRIARMFTRFLFEEGGIDAVTIPNMRKDAELLVVLRNELTNILDALEASRERELLLVKALEHFIRVHNEEGFPGYWEEPSRVSRELEKAAGEARAAIGMVSPSPAPQEFPDPRGV